MIRVRYIPDNNFGYNRQCKSFILVTAYFLKFEWKAKSGYQPHISGLKINKQFYMFIQENSKSLFMEETFPYVSMDDDSTTSKTSSDNKIVPPVLGWINQDLERDNKWRWKWKRSAKSVWNFECYKNLINIHWIEYWLFRNSAKFHYKY